MNLPRRAEPFRAFILSSAARHGLDPCFLAAIFAHESNWDPNVIGDFGHGHGLGQIDDRSHAEFLAKTLPDGTPMWKVPELNIEESARILAAPMARFAEYVSPEAAMAAAYNAGGGATHHAMIHLALNNLTRPTTLQDEVDCLDQICAVGHENGEPVYYVTDVLARRAQFAAPTQEST